MVITSACGAENTGSIPVGHPSVFFKSRNPFSMGSFF